MSLSPEIVQGLVSEISEDFERELAGWEERNADFLLSEAKLVIKLAIARASAMPVTIKAAEQELAKLKEEKDKYAYDYLLAQNAKEAFEEMIAAPDWFQKVWSDHILSQIEQTKARFAPQ